MFRNNRCFDGKEDYPQMEDNQMNMCAPIYECPCERVCHREINHVVEHIQPINTRIVNHHVYHHTYKPCYSSCEENEVCNVYDQNPCNFR